MQTSKNRRRENEFGWCNFHLLCLYPWFYEFQFNSKLNRGYKKSATAKGWNSTLQFPFKKFAANHRGWFQFRLMKQDLYHVFKKANDFHFNAFHLMHWRKIQCIFTWVELQPVSPTRISQLKSVCSLLKVQMSSKLTLILRKI